MRERRVRKRGCAGFSLTETLIAVLLIATVVSGVFSVSLSSQTMGIKTTERARMQQEVMKVMEQIKAYVNAGDFNAPGPTPAPPGQAQWRIPGVVHPGGWALGEGAWHDVTVLLPPEMRNPPPNGRGATLRYFVTRDPNTGGRSVRFEARWAD